MPLNYLYLKSFVFKMKHLISAIHVKVTTAELAPFPPGILISPHLII